MNNSDSLQDCRTSVATAEEPPKSWSIKVECSRLPDEWFNPSSTDDDGSKLPTDWFRPGSVHEDEDSNLWEDVRKKPRHASDKNPGIEAEILRVLNDITPLHEKETLTSYWNDSEQKLQPLPIRLLYYAKRYLPHPRSFRSVLKWSLTMEPRALQNRRRLRAVLCACRRRQMTANVFETLKTHVDEWRDSADKIFIGWSLIQIKKRRLANLFADALSLDVYKRRLLFNKYVRFMSKVALEEFLHRCHGPEPPRSIWQMLKFSDSIRVFQLSRDIPGNLCFSLFEKRLSDMPTYTALSYVWGKPGNVASIKNQYGTYPLRRNLFRFLACIAKRIDKGEIPSKTLFWVDALCINQESVEEKNQQVQQIGRTFQQAEKVIVWLGTHQDREPDCLDDAMKRRFNPWDRLSTHVYWSRMWIIQEFTTASALVLFDESTSVRYSDFQKKRKSLEPGHKLRGLSDYDELMKIRSDKAFEKLIKYDDEEDESFDRNREQTLMDRVIDTRDATDGKRSAEELIDIISRCKDQKCVDSRDKVYAILSLSTLHSSFKVDYNIKPSQLFWRVMCTSARAVTLPLAYDALAAMNLLLCNVFPIDLNLPGAKHTAHQSDLGVQITMEEWQEVHDKGVSFGHASAWIKPIVAFDGQGLVINTVTLSVSKHIAQHLLLSGTVQEDDYLLSISSADFQVVLRRSCSRTGSFDNSVDAVGFAAERKHHSSMKSWFDMKKVHMKYFFPQQCGRCICDKFWISVPFFVSLLILNAGIDGRGLSCLG